MRVLKVMFAQPPTLYTGICMPITRLLHGKVFGAVLLYIKSTLPQLMLFSYPSFYFRYVLFQQMDGYRIPLMPEPLCSLEANKAFAVADKGVLGLFSTVTEREQMHMVWHNGVTEYLIAFWLRTEKKL